MSIFFHCQTLISHPPFLLFSFSYIHTDKGEKIIRMKLRWNVIQSNTDGEESAWMRKEERRRRWGRPLARPITDVIRRHRQKSLSNLIYQTKNNLTLNGKEKKISTDCFRKFEVVSELFPFLLNLLSVEYCYVKRCPKNLKFLDKEFGALPHKPLKVQAQLSVVCAYTGIHCYVKVVGKNWGN